MRKLYTLCLTALLGCQAFAQSQPERIVVHQKNGSMVGFLPERVDSISFPTVEGQVAANVEVVSTEFDKIVVNITRTPSCQAFKLSNIPEVMASRLTDDGAMIDFVNKESTNLYYSDFTNGVLQDAKMEPNTKYVLVTVGYDAYSTPCSVVRTPYTTAKKPLVGNPKVTTTASEVGKRSFTMTFEPNGDVGGYAVVAGVAGTMQQQFEQFGPMMGFKNFSDMVKGWGVINEKTYTWKDMEPDTEYDVFVQAWDKENTYADCDTIKVTTQKMGDSGVASVGVTLGEYKLSEWDGQMLPSQFITYTPDSHTACYRFSVVLDSDYQKDPEGYKSELPKDPPMPNMANWFFYETLTTDYAIAPNTKYVVLTVGRNADQKWSDVQVQTFTTPAQVSGQKAVAAQSLSEGKSVKARDVRPSKYYVQPGTCPFFLQQSTPLLKEK